MEGISSLLNPNNAYKVTFYANKEKKKELLVSPTSSGRAAMTMLKKVIEEKLIEDFDDIRNIRESNTCFALYCGDTKKIFSIRDYQKRPLKFWYDTYWERGDIDYLIEVSGVRVDDTSILQSVVDLSYPKDCKKLLSEGLKKKEPTQEELYWAFITR